MERNTETKLERMKKSRKKKLIKVDFIMRVDFESFGYKNLL